MSMFVYGHSLHILTRGENAHRPPNTEHLEPSRDVRSLDDRPLGVSGEVTVALAAGWMSMAALPWAESPVTLRASYSLPRTTTSSASETRTLQKSFCR